MAESTVERRIVTAWGVLRWVAVAAFVLGGSWFVMNAKVDTLAKDVARVEAASQSKAAADGDQRVLMERLKSIDDKLGAIDERLKNLENKRR